MKIKKYIQHNTKQWYLNAFSGPNLKIKNGEQLKHRNITVDLHYDII